MRQQLSGGEWERRRGDRSLLLPSRSLPARYWNHLKPFSWLLLTVLMGGGSREGGGVKRRSALRRRRPVQP